MYFLLLSCATEAPLPATPVATAAEATPARETNTDPAELGARVFTDRCASCHGEQGKGDGPAAAGLQPKPKDLSRPRLPEERKPPSRMEIIRSGSPGTAMVGFAGALSAEELDAVIGHVQALAHGGQAPADCAGGGGGGAGNCAECAGEGGCPDCAGGGQGRGGPPS